jgi:hypothetical protein
MNFSDVLPKGLAFQEMIQMEWRPKMAFNLTTEQAKRHDGDMNSATVTRFSILLSNYWRLG